MSHENIIERTTYLNLDGTLPSVNLTSTNFTYQNQDKSVASEKKFVKNFAFNNQNFNRGGKNTSQYNQNGRFNNRGNRNWNNNNRPQCQLYGKFGHTAMKCYFRFDQSFNNPAIQPPRASNSPMRNTSNTMAALVTTTHPNLDNS